MLLPDCLYDSNLTYMSIRNGHKFQSDICPFGMDVNSHLTYVHLEWTQIPTDMQHLHLLLYCRKLPLLLYSCNK